MTEHSATRPEEPPTRVPAPPSPFDALAHVVRAGALLHRVHDLQRAANAFNPGVGAPTRFAHFEGGEGVVPSLYAAATPDVAICESLLHDVPLTGGVLPFATYATRTITTLKLERDVRLAKFMGPGLRRLGVAAQDLITTTGDIYGQTVLWAQAAHAAGFEGLAWMSARENTAEAYVFFGDRVAAKDLAITRDGLGTFAPGGPGFRRLQAYCALAKVELLLA